MNFLSLFVGLYSAITFDNYQEFQLNPKIFQFGINFLASGFTKLTKNETKDLESASKLTEALKNDLSALYSLEFHLKLFVFSNNSQSPILIKSDNCNIKVSKIKELIENENTIKANYLHQNTRPNRFAKSYIKLIFKMSDLVYYLAAYPSIYGPTLLNNLTVPMLGYASNLYNKLSKYESLISAYRKGNNTRKYQELTQLLFQNKLIKDDIEKPTIFVNFTHLISSFNEKYANTTSLVKIHYKVSYYITFKDSLTEFENLYINLLYSIKPLTGIYNSFNSEFSKVYGRSLMIDDDLKHTRFFNNATNSLFLDIGVEFARLRTLLRVA